MVPLLPVDSTSSSPPWAVTRWRAIARPSPDPLEPAPEQNPAQLCEFDIAFSQVLGCLSAPAHALALDESRTHAFAFHLELFHTARLLVPLSRGPPTLL